MHVIQHTDGTVSAYVTNYGLFDQNPGNADLAVGRINPGATVCMEYSPVVAGDADPAHRIVKFFVYYGNGNGATAPRQPSAELDGFGQKFVPNLCLNCHGGTYTPGNPNMQSSFREWDLATFKYAGFRDTPNAAEKTAFQQQNFIIRDHTEPRQSIKDLINGWYSGASTDQDVTWNPALWNGAPQQQLYHDVVEKSCRTCHVAFVSANTLSGINWATFDQFKYKHDPVHGDPIGGYVCGPGRYMPHALITYRNFWLSTNPSQSAKLRDFITTGWLQIGNCPQ
jgi:cytochrome c5